MATFPISVTSNIRPLEEVLPTDSTLRDPPFAPAPAPSSPKRVEVKLEEDVASRVEVKLEEDVPSKPLPVRQHAQCELPKQVVYAPQQCETSTLLKALASAFLVGGITGAALCYAFSGPSYE